MWFVMLFLGLTVFAALAVLTVACDRFGGSPS
jgi:hypothetical protein